MLVDKYALTKAFCNLILFHNPSAAQQTPPSSFVRRVEHSMNRMDPLLKTLQVRASPPEGLVQAYLIHIADRSDTNFRKIDIDQYEEDVLLDSELYDTDPRDPAQALNDVKQNAAVVRSSLAKYVLKLQHGPMYRTSDRLAGMIMSAR